jgi:hypothetical protein
LFVLSTNGADVFLEYEFPKIKQYAQDNEEQEKKLCALGHGAGRRSEAGGVTVGSGQMSGATAMTLNASQSSFDSDGGVLTLNFTSVASGSTIEAGTPFIVKWTGDNVISPVFSGVTVSSTTAGSVVSEDGNVRFQGTDSPTVIYSTAHNNLYLGADNTLY